MNAWDWIRTGGAILAVGAGIVVAWPRIRSRGLVRIALFRALVGVMLLASAFSMAAGIDRFGADGSHERIIVVILMMLSMLYGVIVLVSLVHIGGRDEVLPLRPLKWLVGSFVVGAAAIYGAFQLQEWSGFPMSRSVVAMLGAGIVAVTLARPFWFWEQPKARFMRDLVGDRVTFVVYIATGVIIFGLALFGVGDWGR